MLISRVVTLFLVPIGITCSALGLLPISFQESILGFFIGYFLLWGIAKIFYYLTKKEGIGLGDAELLSFIGAFTGILGCWIALLLGSLAGSIGGIIYLLITGSKKIPFGPFLAFGAMSYVLFKPILIRLFFGP